MEFESTGFRLVPSLFTDREVARYRSHFMTLRANACSGDEVDIDLGSSDPLQHFPRMMQPHRWDSTAKDFLLEPRIDAWLSKLLGASPIAVQTMVYFKPPGARGQALHQDNFYLMASPGTCAAAWLALDECNEENGCMLVVPGSHNEPVLCLDEADTTTSFTDVQVPLPPGLSAVPVHMKPGDVLFFNGQIIHGSGPNRSESRFRRSLIAHYVEARAEHVSHFYLPAYRMDGTEAALRVAKGGDTCGRYVDGILHRVPTSSVAGHAH